MLRILTAGMFLACSLSAGDLAQAVQLLKSHKYKEAETVLREVVRESPSDAEARNHLGVALLEQNRFAEAEAEFRKAGESEQPAIQVGLARAFLGQDKPEEARRALGEALKLKSDYAPAYHYRGVLHLTAGDNNQAVKDLTRAVQLDHGDASAHYHLGMAYSRVKRPDKMVEHFQIFLKLDPNAPEAAKVKSLLRSL